MKKFLRINLPHSARELPLALDASILASAALHARSIRRRRMLLKISFPAVAAAAAVMIASVFFEGVHFSTQPVSPVKNIELSQIKTVKPEIPVKSESVVVADPVVPAAELLALADTSSLEQESYNLALLSDFSIDDESMMI